MDWMKYRFVYFAISAVVILSGLFGLAKWGLNLGVDFKGGTILEYKFEKAVKTEDLKKVLDENNLKVSGVQSTGVNSYIFKFSEVSPDDKKKIFQVIGDASGSSVTELRFETVGPTIGPELVRKTIFAMTIAAVLILLWVAYQFKSIKFGASAVLAMLHDSLVLVGSFAILGHFMGAEIDFLFVTAALTILSFSVHDTIVVYDRIRESQKKSGGDLYHLANRAVSETMVRSLNNSFTIVFMLVALVLLGGTTIKWFSVALLIGTISGTYSSPFVAVPILVTWDKLAKRATIFKK